MSNPALPLRSRWIPVGLVLAALTAIGCSDDPETTPKEDVVADAADHDGSNTDVAEDTGLADTGVGDAGPPDSGADTGVADVGANDAGPGCDASGCSTSDPCKQAACVGGSCVISNRPDGEACDDGNKCTKGGGCVIGLCLGATPVTCDDGAICTADACDPATGKCKHTLAKDGDGKPLCACLTDTDCKSDGNSCTVTGCADFACKTIELSGTPCADGDGCTVGDACKDGSCVVGPKKTCADNNVCTADSCDVQTGNCVFAKVKDGGTCDDNDACTAGDGCVGGVCMAKAATTCVDSNPCTADYCDKKTGLCVHGPASAGTACGKGMVCLGTECVARGNSCAGKCGQSAGSCDCDPACVAKGTCCPDYKDVCAVICQVPTSFGADAQQVTSFAIAPSGEGCDITGKGGTDNRLGKIYGPGSAKAYADLLKKGSWSMLLAATGYNTATQKFTIARLDGRLQTGCDPTTAPCAHFVKRSSYDTKASTTTCPARTRMDALVGASLPMQLTASVVTGPMMLRVPLLAGHWGELAIDKAMYEGIVADKASWKTTKTGLLCGSVRYDRLIAAFSKLPASAFTKFGGLEAFKKTLATAVSPDIDRNQDGVNESVSVAFKFTTVAAKSVKADGCTPGSCNDGNACTDEVCNAATGKCTFTPRKVGSACGVGRTCFPGGKDQAPVCKLLAKCGDSVCDPGEYPANCPKDCKLGTCAARCGFGYDAGHDCQCDAQCGFWGDCCKDAKKLCALPDKCGNEGTTPCRRLSTSVSGGCMVTKKGTVNCWGRNHRGQLGAGDRFEDGGKIRPVPGLTDVRVIAAGHEHRCALKADGTVWCWGANAHGQVGNGKWLADYAPLGKAVTQLTSDEIAALANEVTAVRVVGVSGAVDIATADNASCAVLKTGQALCWGANAQGQIGQGQIGPGTGAPGTIANVALAAAVTGLHDADAIVASTSSFCARTVAGATRCWGLNRHGAIGNGRLASSYPKAAHGSVWAVETRPVTAQLHHKASRLHGGHGAVCAQAPGGQVRCWGHNPANTLLNGKGAGDYDGGQGVDGAVEATPVVVSALFKADDVAMGRYHACSLVGGKVRCWGSPVSAALGDGSTTGSFVSAPVDVPVPVTATAVATASSGHVSSGNAMSCALGVDDGVYCWGKAKKSGLADFLPSGMTPTELTGLPSCASATDCNDGNVCTNDSCVVGGCRNADVGLNGPCDDGNPCTVGKCANKTCHAGDIKSCEDGNACTVDSCDAKTGACVHKAAVDGSPCSDGDACTQPDMCTKGACTAGPCEKLLCDLPQPATVTQVIRTLELPAGVTVGCDLDNDGKGDNRMGKALAAFGAQVKAGLDAQIADGSYLHLLSMHPWTAEMPGSLQVLVGNAVKSGKVCHVSKAAGCWVQADDASFIGPGTKGETCKARHVSKAVLSGGAINAGTANATFPLRLPILGIGLNLRLSHARVVGTVTDKTAWKTTTKGEICAALKPADLSAAIDALPNDKVAKAGLQKATLKAILGGALAPDLDLDGDGKKDAASVYLRFSSHGAQVKKPTN